MCRSEGCRDLAGLEAASLPTRPPCCPDGSIQSLKDWNDSFVSQEEGRVSVSRVLAQYAKRCGFGSLVPPQTGRGCVHL